MIIKKFNKIILNLIHALRTKLETKDALDQKVISRI